jgi:hypothetical protein
VERAAILARANLALGQTRLAQGGLAHQCGDRAESRAVAFESFEITFSQLDGRELTRTNLRGEFGD